MFIYCNNKQTRLYNVLTNSLFALQERMQMILSKTIRNKAVHVKQQQILI
jgi:hypothetical protein